ncbi:MAG: anthranilate phosphoribosyltransferase [Candidatus Omnitrophica bacterium]|nr:anthranilate phosphoribosyltransferase [Candidatus Omnitrophota bacterium]
MRMEASDRLAASIRDKLLCRNDLSPAEVVEFMNELMAGEIPSVLLAEILSAWKTKGETVPELVAAAQVMRRHAVRVHPRRLDLLDTCGTGGDGARTLNVSTLVSVLSAAAGVAVAKHGNRAVSSTSGSADLLAGWGIPAEISPERVAAGIDVVGFGFMFAPLFHPSMKHAAEARRMLKTRTLFNCLGPMTNPAGAQRQLLGVYDGNLTERLAEALGGLGAVRVMVVHGEDGFDEISPCAPTRVSEWHEGRLNNRRIDPEEYGFKIHSADALVCADAQEARARAEAVLEGASGADTDFVTLNAGFALVVAGRVNNPQEGIAMAQTLLSSGAALRKRNEIRDFYSAVNS